MKKILFIISLILIISLALSSCANKASEEQKETESDVPSQSESEKMTVESDEPSQSESEITPLDLRPNLGPEIECELDYERIACEYVVNFEKALNVVIDEFDVYSNTIGSLGPEDRSRVIEDIARKDPEADLSQIEDLNDFHSYLIKLNKASNDCYTSNKVLNFKCKAFIEESSSDENLAHVNIRFYRVHNYIKDAGKAPEELMTDCTEALCFYDVYLYKNGETWLIYNITSDDYWAAGRYRGKDYDQLYTEDVEFFEKEKKFMEEKKNKKK